MRILEPARAPNNAPPAPDFLEAAFDELASLFVGVVKSLREPKRLTLPASVHARMHMRVLARVCICLRMHVCMCSVSIWLCIEAHEQEETMQQGVKKERLSTLALERGCCGREAVVAATQGHPLGDVGSGQRVLSGQLWACVVRVDI